MDTVMPDHLVLRACRRTTIVKFTITLLNRNDSMDMTHLDGFIDGMMRRKDLEAMLPHMADDMVLKTPLVAELFKGKAAIRPVVTALMGVVDKFHFREIMQGPQHVSVFFGLTVGSVELDGMDYIRLNEAGLVQEMTVLWRPLPAVVAVLNGLNRAGSQPVLELVPASGG
jgi:hypothetical protein